MKTKLKIKSYIHGATILCFILILFAVHVKAQDVITKNDKTEIKVKVIEITEDVIKYRDWSNPSGPIYNISKSKVFMITYQGGKREFVNNNIENGNVANMTNNSLATDDKPSAKDPRFIFTPRDKSQPKSKTNYGDHFGNIGVTLNSLGKTTIPTISIIHDFFFMPNIAFTFGVNGSYNKEEAMGYSMSATSFGILAGGSYYLNELLKLEKTKVSLYGGAALVYTNTSTSSDLSEDNISSGGIDFLLRAGGRYHFSKRIGAFGELQVSGGTGFVAGISILFFK